MPGAAIVHDFDHPGVNNDFLIKTRHMLALTHNDSSPLEAHHISSAIISTHADEDVNFVRFLSRQDENILRATCIELVLATDMKKHFGLVSFFQVSLSPGNSEQPAAMKGIPKVPDSGHSMSI